MKQSYPIGQSALINRRPPSKGMRPVAATQTSFSKQQQEALEYALLLYKDFNLIIEEPEDSHPFTFSLIKEKLISAHSK